MAPTRRSVANAAATTNPSIMGNSNSIQSDPVIQSGPTPSNGQSSLLVDTPSSNSSFSHASRRSRPFPVDMFSRPRLPSFTAATTEVLRRLTGTPPLPIPESEIERAKSEAIQSSRRTTPAAELTQEEILISDPKPSSTPNSLPSPMITAAEAIKLRREANAKKTPDTPPLPSHTTPNSPGNMSRKRAASKMEHEPPNNDSNEPSNRSAKVAKTNHDSSRLDQLPAMAGGVDLDQTSNSASKDVSTDRARPRSVRRANNRDSVDKPKSRRTTSVKKRKRAKNGGNEGEGSGSDSASSEDYNPQATVTKSGRQISRPNNFQPPPPPSSANASSSVHKPHPGKKVFRRKAGESSVCEHCLRGTSPSTNQIVFCDGCNRAWHQHCHDPVIEAKLLKDKNKDWYCSECRPPKPSATTKPHILTSKHMKTPPAATQTPPQSKSSEASVPPLDMKGRIGGENYSGQQKRNYLQTLPHAHLVSLLLYTSSLNPQLPLFPTSLPPAPPPSYTPLLPPTSVRQPAPILTYSQLPAAAQNIPTDIPIWPPLPISDTPAAASSTTAVAIKPALKLPPKSNTKSKGVRSSRKPRIVAISASPTPTDSDLDEEELPYPKPGNGIRLPPEEEDLDILLDDPYCPTYSHRIRGVQQPVEPPPPSSKADTGVGRGRGFGGDGAGPGSGSGSGSGYGGNGSGSRNGGPSMGYSGRRGSNLNSAGNSMPVPGGTGYRSLQPNSYHTNASQHHRPNQNANDGSGSGGGGQMKSGMGVFGAVPMPPPLRLHLNEVT